jgi:hypothetical protein
VADPVRTSPVPNTPRRPVPNVTASEARRPFFVAATPSAPVASQSSSGPWPMASRTRSQSMTNSVPGTGAGRRRPEASGSPSAMRWNSTPMTLPASSVTMRVGAAWKIARAPSSSISWTSLAAGMSFMSRRYTSVTSAAPCRIEVREQSIEVKPPPMTTTRVPSWPG